ncbi:MAG: hypothetical protein LBE04_03545 [Prevotellaceae bacterium]|jgi:hypothetical protein|nr:hypothetical protein [Prevotellaceae bacterium]
MNTKLENYQKPLKKGWVTELAKLCKCTTVTVSNAIHHNSPGVKAEKVRQMYRIKYLNRK